MAARGITEWLLEDDPHCIDDFRRNRGAGIKIQVNTSIRSRHGSYTLSARTVRNPAAANLNCANTDSARPKIRAAKTDGRIVHAHGTE